MDRQESYYRYPQRISEQSKNTSHYLITVSKMWIAVYDQITTSQNSNAKYPQCGFDVVFFNITILLVKIESQIVGFSIITVLPTPTGGMEHLGLRFHRTLHRPAALWRTNLGSGKRQIEISQKNYRKTAENMSGCDITPSVSEQAS